jgi:hypothetical protein
MSGEDKVAGFRTDEVSCAGHHSRFRGSGERTTRQISLQPGTTRPVSSSAQYIELPPGSLFAAPEI